jgi:hypothetical protein
VADTKRVGEVRPVQAVAKSQVKDRAVAVRQAPRGLCNQIGELGACSQGVGAGVVGLDVRQFVRWRFALAIPQQAQRFVARDRVQSWAQFVGLSLNWGRRVAARQNVSWTQSAAASKSRSIPTQKSCSRSA